MKHSKITLSMIVLIMACVMILSCEKEVSIKKVIVESSDNDFINNKIDFSSEINEKIITFRTNTDWNITIDPSIKDQKWCVVTPNQGVAGSIKVSIKVDANNDYDDRNLVIKLQADTLVKRIHVNQKKKDAILVSKDKFEFDKDGGVLNVEVRSNVNYNVIIPEDYRSWILHPRAKTKGLTSNKLNFEIKRNEDIEKREGYILIENETIKEKIYVYQKAGDPVLILGKKEINLDASENAITVDVSSNFDFKTTIVGDWIKVLTTKSLSSHTLHYKVLANDGYENRDAYIVFSEINNLISDTLFIYQKKKDVIIIDQKNYRIPPQGGVFEVEVESNLEYEIVNTADWVKKQSTKSMHSKRFYFEVSKNQSGQARSAEILFKSTESEFSEIVKVEQQPYIPVESIKINNSPGYYYIGSTGSVSISVYPQNATIDTIVWSSSNSQIVSVVGMDRSALFKTHDLGSATITASTSDKTISASCEVSTLLNSFTWNEDYIVLVKGQKKKLNFSYSPQSATNVTGKWSYFAGTGNYLEVVEISPDAEVKALNSGVVGIKPDVATASGLSKCTIKVIDEYVENEYNDTPDYANELVVGYPMRFRISSMKDQDWFKIKSSGYVTFKYKVYTKAELNQTSIIHFEGYDQNMRLMSGRNFTFSKDKTMEEQEMWTNGTGYNYFKFSVENSTFFPYYDVYFEITEIINK